jgi:hypothetical protein
VLSLSDADDERTPEGLSSPQLHFLARNERELGEVPQELVVSGYKAQYRGTGTVNGETGYNFLLTGYDGQVRGNGNTGVDRFRIKITRNGQTVFDNRMGSSEDIDSANPQDLGGGSIVIHSA